VTEPGPRTKRREEATLPQPQPAKPPPPPAPAAGDVTLGSQLKREEADDCSPTPSRRRIPRAPPIRRVPPLPRPCRCCSSSGGALPCSSRPHPPTSARLAVPALRSSASGRPPPPLMPHLSAYLPLVGTPPYYPRCGFVEFLPLVMIRSLNPLYQSNCKGEQESQGGRRWRSSPQRRHQGTLEVLQLAARSEMDLVEV
jgi:hypothetical protein